MNEMRRLMEAMDNLEFPNRSDLENPNRANIGDKSLATLVQEMEQPFDNVYVKLREEYGEEIAEKYKSAFNAVWEILEHEVEYGHESYHPESTEEV